MILPAQKIRAQLVPDRSAPGGTRRMVEPFVERGAAHGRSYGLSCAGYDVRIAEDLWLWPFWGRLASTIEHFSLPTSIIARVHDKSSWARKFVFVQNTVAEPGWRGYLTLELTRFLPWPIKIKAGTPIAQIIFERLEEPTEQPYAGRYQDQAAGAQPAIEATEANVG